MNSKVPKISVPLDYRRHLISFIKKLLSDSSFGQRFRESTPGYSPYVFSIYFNRILRINPDVGTITIEPPLSMTFSTSFFELMTDVCNKAMALMDEKSIFGLNIEQIQVLPNTKIETDTVKFTTMGHAILRGKRGYLDNTDIPEIEESINTHLQNKLGFFSQNIAPFSNSVYSLIKVVDSRLKKGVCLHYGGKITAVTGDITLSGYPASLQFLYDHGLGVRTGQGFGLLKVVKQL